MSGNGSVLRLQRVPPEIIERLRCPRCGSPVVQDAAALICTQGHTFPYRDGYFDVSVQPSDEASRKTLQSFGYEWSTFDKIQQEDEGFWHRYFSDVPLNDLVGKVGLDAGCGKGRFSYFAAPHLDTIIALDGSDAVSAAARNLAGFDNVCVVKADLTSLPLREDSFGFIWCLGVLHHLTDPEGGFRALTARLEPGGRLLIYVYSRPTDRGARAVGLAAATWLRKLTVHIPHPLLRWLSGPIALMLYAGVVLPGRYGPRLRLPALHRLPLHTYRGRPLRSLWLDTFDRLSAPLEKRYVWADISPWFEAAGLTVESVREDAGLIVLARRSES